MRTQVVDTRIMTTCTNPPGLQESVQGSIAGASRTFNGVVQINIERVNLKKNIFQERKFLFFI